MEKRCEPPPYAPPQPGTELPLGVYPDLGNNPPPIQQHTVIVTHQGPPMVFGPIPASVMCPSCHAQIVTTVETEATTKTHLFALLLCLFGCYPCCCIPYCVESCQSQQHFCPNCKAYLGSYNI